ncbi:hypothetical protein HS088_TW20G00401 [Tripterygium wilfordii]|uniref:Uncharacterized protein n=1 Tax=Tripterygium wilfordii TaxID=458696 RepID=A0A7J7C7C4_TRIWF|nr:hypothetical protein HS088_TW20G00401 [Tripterygium wilfordii]
MDIAIVKATNHYERPAREKHIRSGWSITVFNSIIITNVVFPLKLTMVKGKLMTMYLFLLSAIYAAPLATRPHADVAYCIHALARRLSKTHNWEVRLRTKNLL